MSDFVTLSCPSCGGKLTVQKNTPTYICDYCGTEHKLREEDIEFFGRCPKCHRNDRVEKITAIANKHDTLAAKFLPPNQLNLDRFLLRTDLAIQQRLNSLDTLHIPDNVYKKRSYYFFIAMVVLLLQTCCILLMGIGTESDILAFFYLVSLLGVFILAILGILNSIKGARNLRIQENQTQNRKSTLEKELLTQQKQVNNQKEILMRKLRLRYDKIYYCHRDDLLFIPGETGYASCNDYENFLTHVLKTNKKA